MILLDGTPYYQSGDVARACGLSRHTVTRYFRFYTNRKFQGAWNRLDQAEFDKTVAELNECIEALPHQPLRALKWKRRGQAATCKARRVRPLRTRQLATATGLSTFIIRRYLVKVGMVEGHTTVTLTVEQFERARVHLLDLKAKCPGAPLRQLATERRAATATRTTF